MCVECVYVWSIFICGVCAHRNTNDKENKTQTVLKPNSVHDKNTQTNHNHKTTTEQKTIYNSTTYQTTKPTNKPTN